MLNAMTGGNRNSNTDPSPTQSYIFSPTDSTTLSHSHSLTRSTSQKLSEVSESAENSPGWQAWKEKRRQERKVLKESPDGWAMVRRTSSLKGLSLPFASG